MPVRPTAKDNGHWGTPPGGSPTAGDVVVLGAAVNLIYSGIVIYALANPDGRLGTAVRKWIEIGRTLFAPAYSLAGSAGCGDVKLSPFIARAWSFDIHLIVINLIVAAVLTAASQRYWADWSRQLHGALDRLGLKGDAGADAGYVTVLCGAIAVLWWLLLKDDLFDSAAHCASLQPWRLWRIPLLVITAHGLVCVAASFWVARDP